MPQDAKSALDDFESSMQKLEEIVRKMEQGELSLEQSLSAFEEGVSLTRACQETLKSAEQRVSKLVQQGDTLIAEPLEGHRDD